MDRLPILDCSLGALIAGPVSDRYGRKPIFQWALFMYAFGTFLSAIAPSYEFLLAARFITGLGIARRIPRCGDSAGRVRSQSSRHIWVGTYRHRLLDGLVCLRHCSNPHRPEFGWRALYFVGVTPALLIIYVRRYVPESVRFLLEKGRIEEAGAIVRKMAARSGITDIEFVPPDATKTPPKLSLFKQYSMLRVFAVAIIVLGLFQLANNVQVVGFGTWLPSIFVRAGFTLTKSFKFTMIVLAVTPLGQIFGIWLQDRMPRKWAMFLLASVSAVCFFGFGLAFEYKYPIAVIVACNVGYQFFSGAISPINTTLGTELFPPGFAASHTACFPPVPVSAPSAAHSFWASS